MILRVKALEGREVTNKAVQELFLFVRDTQEAGLTSLDFFGWNVHYLWGRVEARIEEDMSFADKEVDFQFREHHSDITSDCKLSLSAH